MISLTGAPSADSHARDTMSRCTVASKVLRLGEQSAVSLPNKTMVVSRTLQSYYRERYGAGTIHIPNGAAVRERCPISRVRDWGIEPEQYVLFLGRFSPEKNCHLLIEAFGRLETPVDLVLAGAGQAPPAAMRKCSVSALAKMFTSSITFPATPSMNF